MKTTTQSTFLTFLKANLKSTFLTFLILNFGNVYAATSETWECALEEDYEDIEVKIAIFNSRKWGTIFIDGITHRTQVEFREDGIRSFVYGDLDKKNKVFPFRFNLAKENYGFLYEYKPKTKPGKKVNSSKSFYCRQTS